VTTAAITSASLAHVRRIFLVCERFVPGRRDKSLAEGEARDCISGPATGALRCAGMSDCTSLAVLSCSELY